MPEIGQGQFGAWQTSRSVGRPHGMLAGVSTQGRSERGARPALVGLLVLAAGAAGLVSARGAGVEDAAPDACPATSATPAFPARAGRDRMILPVGYRELAPVTATVCRYRADGTLSAALALDAARTARLAALLAAPPAGWPDDALAAKTITTLTDAELARAAVAPCTVAATGDLITFHYGVGADAAVLVRGEPCRSMTNGAITVRAVEPVEQAMGGLG
jgi:hypothetical protein